jgi:Zn-dependent peptidase ImmA (M78 family)/DNA-binding XRE family transcriptional regulator
MIEGERVKQVREMHRLTQTDLANDIPGLKQSQLSRIESGLASDPDEETTALLALSLGVTPGFFHRPPAPNLLAHSPQFRARTRLTQGAKAGAFQWARLVYELHQQLRERANPIPVQLHPMPDASPADAARYVRSLLGFTADAPLPYLILAMERAGVTVLGLPYTVDTLDAFCAWHGEEPIIAVLKDFPGDRLRFSIAHELGHLVLHRPGQTGQKIEMEADSFAAELLIPLKAIARTMPEHPTLSSLTMLKTEWGVSIKSLVRRARELEVIDQQRAISLYKQISSRGWNRAEPGHVPIEKPRALRKLAEILYGPGPNIERLAADAQWSHDLAVQVLDQHATTEELPHQQPRAHIPAANVIELRRPARVTSTERKEIGRHQLR